MFWVRCWVKIARIRTVECLEKKLPVYVFMFSLFCYVSSDIFLSFCTFCSCMNSFCGEFL